MDAVRETLRKGISAGKLINRWADNEIIPGEKASEHEAPLTCQGVGTKIWTIGVAYAVNHDLK